LIPPGVLTSAVVEDIKTRLLIRPVLDTESSSSSEEDRGNTSGDLEEVYSELNNHELLDKLERIYKRSTSASTEDMIYKLPILPTTQTNSRSPCIGVIRIPGWIRERASEILFTPTLSNHGQIKEEEEESLSVPETILECLLKLPIDLRKPIAQNLIVSGGGAMLPGFVPRLKSELISILEEFQVPQSSMTSHSPSSFKKMNKQEELGRWLSSRRKFSPLHPLIEDLDILNHFDSSSSPKTPTRAGIRKSRPAQFQMNLLAWIGGSLSGSMKIGGQEVIRERWESVVESSLGTRFLPRFTPRMNDKQEFLEIKSVSLEWKLSNLKHIFDSSKGDTKSKCVKSAFFGQGKWQVFFYPNSGHDQYCSLYLSCQPTTEEFEKAAVYQLTKHSLLPSSASSSNLSPNSAGLKPLDPNQVPWQREGLFKFTFEIKSLDRRTTYKTMEANDHAFSHEARNWGWAQYWRRNDAYYSNPSAKYNDTFLICCTIVYSPTPPAPQPTTQTIKKLMPLDLLEAYSSLFNDPLYSDVCFKIIRRRRQRDGSSDQKGTSNVVVRRLYASKKILIRRSEYFSTMFGSGFAESTVTISNDSSEDPIHQRDFNNSDRFGPAENGEEDDEDDLMEEDSDDCDDDENVKNEEFEDEEILEEPSLQEHGLDPYEAGAEITKRDSVDHGLNRYQDNDDSFSSSNHDKSLQSDASADRSLNILSSDGMTEENGQSINYGTIADNSSVNTLEPSPALDPQSSHLISSLNSSVPNCPITTPGLKITYQNHHPSQDNRIITSKIGHCSTDLSPIRNSNPSSSAIGQSKQVRKPTNLRSSRKMTVIEVTDAAYTTFKALLYFLYTDSISFAPLSSTYHCLKDEALETGLPFPYPTRKSYGNAMIAKAAFIGSGGQSVPSASAVDSSLVCSAKAIYRLADKLNLTELKSRAFEHITRSLTVQNIPMEVFSSFTSAYEEIRKIEVNYMLTNWNEVRDGRSMKTVLKMLSDGGKVCSGFSEIWSVLLSNLEFKPKVIDSNSLNLAVVSGAGAAGAGAQQPVNHLQIHSNDSSQDAVVTPAGGTAAIVPIGAVPGREGIELLWNPTDRPVQGGGGSGAMLTMCAEIEEDKNMFKHHPKLNQSQHFVFLHEFQHTCVFYMETLS
ncbi:hypothetical protein PSHT_16261, partial [Puccinia striiformis]